MKVSSGMKHVEMRLIQDTISAFLSQSLPIRRRDFSQELSCEAEKSNHSRIPPRSLATHVGFSQHSAVL